MGFKIGDKVVYYQKELLGTREEWKWFSQNEGEITGKANGSYSPGPGWIVRWDNVPNRFIKFFEHISELKLQGDTTYAGIGSGLLWKKEDLILEVL